MPLRDECDGPIIPRLRAMNSVSRDETPRTVFAALSACDQRNARELISPSSASPASEETNPPPPPPMRRSRLRILPDSRAPWGIEEWEAVGKPTDVFTKRGYKIAADGSTVKGKESGCMNHKERIKRRMHPEVNSPKKLTTTTTTKKALLPTHPQLLPPAKPPKTPLHRTHPARSGCNDDPNSTAHKLYPTARKDFSSACNSILASRSCNPPRDRTTPIQ